MFNVNKLALSIIATIGALGVSFCTGYVKGGNHERLKQQQIQSKITAKYNDDMMNIINISVARTESNNIKFRELENEINQSNSNLRACQLNANQLRIVYRSANVQVPASASVHATTITESTADSESGIELNAADLAATLIKHDEMYFNCKNVVDAWQSRYYDEIGVTP